MFYLFLFTILLSYSPVAISIYLTKRDTLLSSFKFSHTISVNSSISPSISTHVGSPSKLGSGFPSPKSDVDSYFEDIQSKVENLRDWGEQWKALAKDLFNELLKIDSDNTIDSYLSYEALEKIKEHLKNQ